MNNYINKLSPYSVHKSVLLLYIIFTAVCKRGVCKHQSSSHDQDFQQTVFCHLLFVPRKQLSEREHEKYITYFTYIICHKSSKKK